jgi:nucleotide-binding universal stress UspA family protein
MLAAPHDSVIRPDRLLLATDDSEDAMLAARVAIDLSLRTGVRVHVVHAWYHLAKGLAYPTLVWSDYSNLYEREARRTLEAQVDTIEASGCAVAQSHLLHGPRRMTPSQDPGKPPRADYTVRVPDGK